MPQTRDLFTDHGLRCTKQRCEVYRALAATKSHPTADELYQLVQRGSPGTSLATVYNTLEVFSRAGLVRRIPTADGATRYDADLSDHLHVVTDDGRVVDVPDDLCRRFIEHMPPGLVSEIEQRLGVRVCHLNVGPVGCGCGGGATTSG